MRYFQYILSSLILVTFVAAEANYLIYPVKLKLSKEKKITELYFSNDDAGFKNFQIIPYKVENVQGKQIYKETKDLIVTPLMFTLTPDRNQLIRVASRNNDIFGKKKILYMLALKELPNTPKKQATALSFIMEFRVPVSIE